MTGDVDPLHSEIAIYRDSRAGVLLHCFQMVALQLAFSEARALILVPRPPAWKRQGFKG